MWKCKTCGATKKNDETDPLYCSVKCRLADGAEVVPKQEFSDIKIVEAEEVKDALEPSSVATLVDYYARPSQYHRRLDPERLNWAEPLSAPQLKQCGFRCNRKPVPGDWDYTEEV